MKRGHVGPAHGRACRLGLLVTTGLLGSPMKRRLAPVVVFDAAFALLFLGEPDALKSKLKSSPNEDAQGNVHPILRLYACSF